MSITGHNNNINKLHKKIFHRRNNSGELDVFEAAKYFSSAAAAADQNRDPGPYFPDTRQKNNIPTRMSLDLPIMRNVPITPPDDHHHHHQPTEKNKKPHKHQPSSPGGRLASFLNSLFNQASLRKKMNKPPKPGESSLEKDETTPGHRRKRRSSVSHFRIITSSADSAAAAGDKPPSCADTPTKSYRAISSSLHGKHGGNVTRTTLRDEMIMGGEEKCSGAKFCYYEKNRAESNRGGSEERGFGKVVVGGGGDDDDDNEYDSDSSSDLFDLPSHELDFYSSGLPVYETTHMDRIKINVAPISRATTV